MKKFNPFDLDDEDLNRLQQQEPGKKEEPQKTEQQQQQQQEIDYKAKYESLSFLDSDEGKELLSLLEAEEGPDPKAKVVAFATKAKTAIGEVTELQKKEAEREAWFRDNQIQNSREYQDRYIAPVQKALDLYNGLLGEETQGGQPVNEEAYKKLRTAIFNKGNDLSVAETKALLRKFSDDYTAKFGKEPVLPTVKEILDAKTDLVAAEAKRLSALQNWEQEKKAREEAAKAKQAEDLKQKREGVLAQRREQHLEAKQGFNYAELSEFFEEAKVREAFDEQHGKVMAIIEGKAGDIEYKDYLSTTVKAALFDQLLAKSKELKSIADDIKKSKKIIDIGSGNPDAKKEGDKTGKSTREFFGF